MLLCVLDLLESNFILMYALHRLICHSSHPSQSLYLSTFKITKMSTIAFSVLIVLFVVFLFIGLIYINNNQKKKAVTVLLERLSKSGAQNNLTFSSQELLSDAVIGFDAMRLKVLVLHQDNEAACEWHLIDLELVKNCSVKKIYKPFYEGTSNKKAIENYLDKIILLFEFTDNQEPIEINFYRHISNNIYEMQELEHKAKKWETMLLQMTGNKLRQIA